MLHQVIQWIVPPLGFIALYGLLVILEKVNQKHWDEEERQKGEGAKGA